GTYVIQVEGNNLVSTGSYSLGRECLLPTNPVDDTLTCGGLVAHSINAAGQVDQITFTGQTNERVTLTLVQTSGFAGTLALATVFSPTGAVVVAFNANSLPTRRSSDLGTYVIQVEANNLVSTGFYSLGRE